MSDSAPAIREIARNRRAKHDYEILDTLEVGIELVGSEVKTLRAGEVNLAQAYVRIKNAELWLEQARIDEYREANKQNHDPNRRRRLLAHKREIVRMKQRIQEKGLTVIPLRLYFKQRTVKLEIGIARGRKTHDKRQHLKEKDSKRALRRLTR